MPRRSILPAVLLLSILSVAAAGTAIGSQPAERRDDRIPGRYIVVFRRSVDRPLALTERLERAEGFRAPHRYRHALEGFSAALSSTQVRRLRAHPKVALVAADREVRATGTVDIVPPDAAPTGVRRIEAATLSQAHEHSGVNVAVIDTGIDLAHPDLKAINGKDCTGSEPAQDDNGHGTHVAGSIAAENDGSGVIGVAPGTAVWAVKVLNSRGSGSWSQIICGIDWATATRTDGDSSNDIAVANMSLGGVGDPIQSCATTDDPLHRAICTSTDKGITYVVAAGNDAWDFDYAPQPDVPAAYPEVLTVTAVTDSDGAPGGTGGSPGCRTSEVDDRYASFSNYALTAAGRAHTVAGPGVCITSDWPGGGTRTISGTSMATPHLAGLVALCLNEAGTDGACGGMTPAAIIEKVRADAEAHSTATAGYGFTGDPATPVGSRYYGYLAWVGMAPPPPPPPPNGIPPTVTAVTPADGSTGIDPGTTVSVTFSETMDEASTEAAFSLAPTGGAPVAGSSTWVGETMTFDPSVPLAGGTSYTATVSTAAADASGEHLAADHVTSFATLHVTTAAPVSVAIEAGSLRGGGAAQLAADDDSYFQVDSTHNGNRTAAWRGSFAGVPGDLTSLDVSFRGKSSKSCNQTVSIWSFASSSWSELDRRSVGSTEVSVRVTPGGAPANYVSGGEVRVRVACTRGKPSFFTSSDLLEITYSRP